MKKSYYEKPKIIGERKGREVNAKKIIFYSLFALFGFLLIAALYFIFYGSLFRVQKIEFSGSYLLGNDQASQMLLPVIVSSNRFKFFAPDNILFWFFLNQKQAKDKYPPVFGEVRIKTNWKSKTVSINIEERKFFGIWCNGQSSSENECYAFDKEGVLFGKAPEAAGSLILKVYSEKPSTLSLGDYFLKEKIWIENIFETISEFEKFEPYTHLVLIKDPSLEEWETELINGPKMMFSLNFVPGGLYGLLDNLRKKTDLNKLDYIDFRVENRIFTK